MYYVVDPSTNQKFGPADLATLNQWISENRILPTTVLEEAASGNRFNAAQVPGLNFPQAAAPAADPVFAKPAEPVQPTGGPAISQPPGGYGMGPTAPNAEFSRPTGYPQGMGMGYSEEAQKKVTTGWVCFALGLVCCGLVAIYGMLESKKAKEMGHPGAQAPYIANIVVIGLMVVGIIGYAILFATVGVAGLGR